MGERECLLCRLCRRGLENRLFASQIRIFVAEQESEALLAKRTNEMTSRSFNLFSFFLSFSAC